MLAAKGIVLIYNGKNSSDGDTALGTGAYAGGQALFSAKRSHEAPAPASTRHSSKPEMPFEKTGQYAAGTTFLEGLVYFKDRWFAYYGCADSFVAVADAPAKKD